jgi:hypothetical protein
VLRKAAEIEIGIEAQLVRFHFVVNREFYGLGEFVEFGLLPGSLIGEHDFEEDRG